MNIERAIPLDGPFPCDSRALVNGAWVPYVEYRLPEEISRALGMGCAGRSFAVLEGSTRPVAICRENDGGGNPIAEWVGVRPDATERRNLSRSNFMTVTDAHREQWLRAAQVAASENDADAHRNLSQAAAMYIHGSLMPSVAFDALMKEFRRLVVR